MASRSETTEEFERLLERACEGDAVAIAMLFEQQRPRLKRMVALRLDRRLLARIDASDVLQDCWLDYTRRFPDFLRQSSMSLFQWLRFLTAQRLTDLHRKHLGASMRAAGQEVSLYQGCLPADSSAFLAEQLMGRMTSASDVIQRAEIQVLIQAALNRMDEIPQEGNRSHI